MTITVDIPDELVDLIVPGRDLSRRALEDLGIAAYQARRLSEDQLRRLLGFATRHELDSFLRDREVWLDYSLDDLEQDRKIAAELGRNRENEVGKTGSEPTL